MFTTPFIQEKLNLYNNSGYLGIDGYKKVISDNKENELTKKNVFEMNYDLKPYDIFRLNQQKNFYEPLRTNKKEMNGTSLIDKELYTTTATRFNGSQYGYRSISGHNPRGSTWFDVDNTHQSKKEMEGELDEDNINMIAKSSISGYGLPQQGELTAQQRIISKSNDVIPPKFLRGSFTNPLLDPSGNQLKKK